MLLKKVVFFAFVSSLHSGVCVSYNRMSGPMRWYVGRAITQVCILAFGF